MALWTPANLTSVTLEGWYRVHDPAAILGDGSDISTTGSVNTWADQSGNGRTLTKQGSPAYNANGLSTGHPAVTFAFAGFRTAAGAGYPASAVMGSMIIGCINGDGRISSLNGSGQADFSASGFIPMYKSSGNLNYWYNGSTAHVTHTNSTTVAIFEAVPLSSTTADVGINTVLSGTPVTLTGVTIDRMGLFAESDNGTVATAGSCAEHILWAGVISTTELQKLEGYIAWNNGQQALLPGGHPYASAAPTTGGSPSGTLAVTEAGDVGAFTGTFSSGTLAVTEAADVAAFTGTVSVSGTLAVTEGTDVAAFAGGGIVSGTLSTTEGLDTAAFTGTYNVSGTLATTEGQDVAAFAGSFAGVVSGTLAAIEGVDVAAFAITGPVLGTLAATESADVAVFVGTFAGVSIGTLAATEASDTFQSEIWIGSYKIINKNSRIGVSEVFGNNVRVLWTKVYSSTTSFTDHDADIGRVQLQRSWDNYPENEYQLMFSALSDANGEVARSNAAELKSVSDALVYRTHSLQLTFDGVGRCQYDMYVNYSPNIPKAPPLNPRNLNGA